MSDYKNIKKLGLGIVCFSDSEHLINILTELKGLIDYVVVGMQKISYHGDPISKVDYNEIYRLKDEDHLVDEVVEVDLNTKKAAREQECDKRNMLIQHCENNGCSHVLIIDGDEFYTRVSFRHALDIIDQNDYEMTYCQYVNYWYDYQHYLVYPFNEMYVPFVSKVKYRFKFQCLDFTLPSDPTRRYVRPYDKIDKIRDATGKIHEVKHYTVDYYIFPWKDIKMHHLSWVRANIRKKLNTWSSKKCFNDYDDLIDQAVDRFNYFSDDNINEPAKLLFNTPEHKVEIRKFNKQYIHPKYDIYTRLRPVEQDKKIFVLILSCNKPEFLKLEDALRNTYCKDIKEGKYKNIQYLFYRGTNKEEPYIEGDVLFVPNSDGLYNTGTKLLDALTYINQHYKYDYLYRGNLSTWVNIPLLNRFIGYLDNDDNIYVGNIYSAFWSKFYLYGGGEMLIFNKREIDILLKTSINKEARKLEKIIYPCDDNLIFGMINARNIFDLGIDHSKIIKSLGIYRICEDDHYLIDEKAYNYIAIQVKNFFKKSETERNFDSEVRKLYDIEKEFKEKYNSEEYLEKQYKNLISNIDNDCYLLDMQKADYLKWEPTASFADNSHLRFDNKMNKKQIINRLKTGKYGNIINLR